MDGLLLIASAEKLFSALKRGTTDQTLSVKEEKLGMRLETDYQ
jgi:hypothetical protein